jgi:hypothetical protein
MLPISLAYHNQVPTSSRRFFIKTGITWPDVRDLRRFAHCVPSAFPAHLRLTRRGFVTLLRRTFPLYSSSFRSKTSNRPLSCFSCSFGASLAALRHAKCMFNGLIALRLLFNSVLCSSFRMLADELSKIVDEIVPTHCRAFTLLYLAYTLAAHVRP